MSSPVAVASNVLGSLVLAFLLLPILAVVPASFNHASFIRLPPDAWSLRWYDAFHADPGWWQALGASTQVALLATVVAVALGASAALGLERVSARTRSALLAVIVSPLIVPAVMIGIALYHALRPLGLHGTIAGLALAHALLAVPFVVVNVGIALRGIDPNCVRAAEGLGASPWRVFRTVTLPLIAPGLAGGAAFAFVTSFDEVVVSIFLAGAQAKTLPVKLWEAIRVEYTPVTAVASTALLAIALVLFVAVRFALRAAERRAGRGR